MTEKEALVAEIVEELKEPAPKRKRRTKAEIEAAKGTTLAKAEPPKPELTEQAKQWADQAREELELIALCEIESQADMDEMGLKQREAFEKVKELEAERTKLTKPLLETKRGIDDLFKPAVGYWKAIEEACKVKIGAFRKLAAEAQDRALAAVAASGGQADASTLVVAHGANVLQLPEATREVVKWRAEIFDTGLLPEWCWKRVIDREAIDALVQAKGSDADIPGVRVYREVQIVNKAVRG